MSDSSSSDRAALPGPSDGVPGAEEALEGAARSRIIMGFNLASFSDNDKLVSSLGFKSCGGDSSRNFVTDCSENAPQQHSTLLCTNQDPWMKHS